MTDCRCIRHVNRCDRCNGKKRQDVNEHVCKDANVCEDRKYETEIATSIKLAKSTMVWVDQSMRLNNPHMHEANQQY